MVAQLGFIWKDHKTSEPEPDQMADIYPPSCQYSDGGADGFKENHNSEHSSWSTKEWVKKKRTKVQRWFKFYN